MTQVPASETSAPQFTRRRLGKLVLGGGAVVAFGAGGCVPNPSIAAVKAFGYGNPGPLSRRAIHLVESGNTIDMLLQVRNALVVKGQQNSVELVPVRFRKWFDDPTSIQEADLQRYFASGVDVFYPGTDPGITTTFKDKFEAAKWFLNGWRGIRDTHPEWFEFVLTPEDLRKERHRGKLKIILGLQNGDHFRSADDVAYFYGLGQRVSQLTYNSENPLGGGAFSSAGLNPLGREVIRAMNQVGMALDLSHSNTRTALEANAASAVTPIISHTNAEALNPGFNRAAPDELIKAVAARGGVIGLTVVRQFVSPREPTTIEDFVAHIDHIVQLVGIDHVGIGGDTDLTQLDGADDEARRAAAAAPGQQNYQWRDRVEIDGLDHPRRIYDIAETLTRRGYSDSHIRLVLGGNWERVLTHIWSTRIP